MSGKGKRRHLRKILRAAFGDNCCWCDGEMEFPERKKVADNVENLATIEHFFQKVKKQPGNTMLLRLAHKRCNI